MNPRQDVERAIVACVLARGELILDELRSPLQLSDFSSTRCRAILASVIRLGARGLSVDPVAVKAELEARGEFDAAGGAAFLTALADSAPANGRLEFLVQQLADLPAPGEADLPDVGEESVRTDVGAARALVVLHGRDLRYVHKTGWRVWDGTRLVPDRTGEVARRAKGTAEALLHAAVEIGDRAKRDAAVRWALHCHSEARLKAMVRLAATESGIAVTANAFDRDPMLFNVANGTLDLKTGQLHPHNRSDMITKLAPVAFEPAALSPKFDSFVRRIFDGNQRVIGFLQRVVGYAMTGDTRERKLFLAHGPTAGGKTTFVNLLRDLFGDHVVQAPADALLARRRDEHPTAIASMEGARLVCACEVDEGRRLAEALIKQITGRDRVAVRRMRENYREFTPTFKILLAANHLPVIRGTDSAIWQRVDLVPFTVSIPPGEQDKEMPDKLRGELPGILNWAIAGCLAWQKDGLQEPHEVTDATDSYRRNMDVISTFVDQECVVAAGVSVGKGALHQAYVEWCKSAGEEALSRQLFGARLIERHVKEGRTGRLRFWVGIGLPADGDE